MAVEIGALRALLSLDSAAFERGSKRAQASMTNLQRGLSRAADRMTSAGRRLSLGITAPLTAASTLMVRSSLRNIDAQSKLAQSIGTSTRSVQVLARAADRAGISTGELEQITRQLTVRLSDAASGSGPAADALDRLGLSAGDLAGMDLDQTIQTLNTAIEKYIPRQSGRQLRPIFSERARVLLRGDWTLRPSLRLLRRLSGSVCPSLRSRRIASRRPTTP